MGLERMILSKGKDQVVYKQVLGLASQMKNRPMEPTC